METELTYEETELLLEARFRKYPELRAIINGEHFDETLVQILDFEEVSHDFFELIKEEVVIVLALYTPLNELAQNIQESTGLPAEKASDITSLIETLILQPVYNDLLAYQYLWMEELKKEEILPEAPKEVQEKLDLGQKTLEKRNGESEKEVELQNAPVPTFGTVPDASNDLKERLELRPKTVMKQTFSEPKAEESDEEDDGPKPLTRTQILQSLTSKRTMASDIASINKSSNTHSDTHT